MAPGVTGEIGFYMSMKSGVANKLRVIWICICLAAFAGVALLFVHRIEKDRRIAHFASLPDYEHFFAYDPSRMGGHLLPNLNILALGEWRDQPVRFVTNSQGFRSTVEYALEPKPGTYRILLMGDSFIDGMRTDQSQIIGVVLEGLLRSRMPRGNYDDVEVLISGHNNPANAWYYFQEHGRGFHPHLVILGVTLGNDLTWYSFRSSVLAVDRKHVRLSANPVQTGSEKPDLLLPSYAYSEEGSSRLAQSEVEWRWWLSGKFDFLANVAPPVACCPNPSREYHVYAADVHNSFGLFLKDSQPEIAKMYSDFFTVLVGLSALVGESGARFMAVIFPTRFQVSERGWSLLSRQLALDVSAFDLNEPNKRIGVVAQEEGIDVLDLTERLRRGGDDYFRSRGDMHLNELGQAGAANALAEHILGPSGYLPSPAR